MPSNSRYGGSEFEARTYMSTTNSQVTNLIIDITHAPTYHTNQPNNYRVDNRSQNQASYPVDYLIGDRSLPLERSSRVHTVVSNQQSGGSTNELVNSQQVYLPVEDRDRSSRVSKSQSDVFRQVQHTENRRLGLRSSRQVEERSDYKSSLSYASYSNLPPPVYASEIACRYDPCTKASCPFQHAEGQKGNRGHPTVYEDGALVRYQEGYHGGSRYHASNSTRTMKGISHSEKPRHGSRYYGGSKYGRESNYEGGSNFEGDSGSDASKSTRPVMKSSHYNQGRHGKPSFRHSIAQSLSSFFNKNKDKNRELTPADSVSQVRFDERRRSTGSRALVRQHAGGSVAGGGGKRSDSRRSRGDSGGPTSVRVKMADGTMLEMIE